ncbi:MAG: hypothetical protein JO301_18305 [Chitinophagaceae bacterium]|nr:hypothetical protein [Chitinophagaceae bacterium]
MARDVKAATVGVAYLLVYWILLQVDATRDYAVFFFYLSPIVVAWMMYMFLKPVARQAVRKRLVSTLKKRRLPKTRLRGAASPVTVSPAA